MSEQSAPFRAAVAADRGEVPQAIPRVFHQIWINERDPELPDEYRRYRDRWLELHPGWKYKLWNLNNIDFEQKRPELIAQCTHPAQMADILRLEILHRYGGVYLDTDMDPQKPIDSIFEAGVGHLLCSEDGVHFSTSIIGARPGSPLMAKLLDALPTRLGLHAVNAETGPVFVTRQLMAGGFDGDLRVVPQHWFYPYAWDETHRANESFPDAYAIHRWAHSWGGGQTRRAKLMRAVKRALGR